MTSSFLRLGSAALASAFVGLAGLGDARAAIEILQNDGFVENGSVAFQSGFVNGERGAVTLGPVGEAFRLRKVQLLFGPDGGVRTVNLLVYLDDGSTTPGTLLFEGEFEVQASADAISELDLSPEMIDVAGGSIRVALEFTHDGAPSIARDDDGSIQPGRNWIYAGGGWLHSEDVGLQGDWIIRAEIDTLGGGTTSSTSNTSSSASGETTSSSGGPTSTSVSGGTTTASTGAGGAGGVCTPGETQGCVGIGACEGGQSCLADGSGWSACECADSGSGSAGGGDAADGGDDGCGCLVPGAAAPGGVAGFGGALALAALVAARRRRSAR